MKEIVALEMFTASVTTRFGAIVIGVAGVVSLVVPPIPDTTGELAPERLKLTFCIAGELLSE